VPLSRQNILAVGAAAIGLAALALSVANFTGDGDNGGLGPYVSMLAVSVVVASAVFGWAMPRSERPARDGIVVGALGLLALPVYWTGIPYVLGPAAIAFGLLGHARPQNKGAAVTAIVLGVLATVAGVAVVILDQAS
jgi:hypothetical protein